MSSALTNIREGLMFFFLVFFSSKINFGIFHFLKIIFSQVKKYFRNRNGTRDIRTYAVKKKKFQAYITFQRLMRSSLNYQRTFTDKYREKTMKKIENFQNFMENFKPRDTEDRGSKFKNSKFP